MRILVTYYSQTGNTKKIAETIQNVISEEHDSLLKDFNDLSVEELNDYDLVFLGSACHHANLAPEVLRFIEKIPSTISFKLAGFITHATYPPERNTEMFEKWGSLCEKTYEKLQADTEIDYLGYFRCMGVPSKAIELFINAQIVTDEAEWAEYIEEVVKHPDETDIENARIFAKEILEKC